MIAPMLISALLNQYAPQIPRSVAAGICSVESGGDAWALDDDTTHQSYRPRTYAGAIALAHTLISRGHSVDLGLMQVNSVHLGQSGVTIETMLDPASNLRASQTIFTEDLATARGNLRAALSLYNSGSPTYSLGYADKVLAATSSPYGSAILEGVPGVLHEPTLVERHMTAFGSSVDVTFRGRAW